MENSDMIHAVEMVELKDTWYRGLLVHWASQRHIAQFIYYYHFFVYGYLVVFSLLAGLGPRSIDTIINILLIALFLLTAGVILIRRIQVGAKYEAEPDHDQE